MAVLVTQAAPDFKVNAVLPDGSFQDDLSLSQFRGKYVLLFFYPLDFTFVCPTEIIAFSDRIDEFEALGVQVLGASVDSQFSHLAWRNLPRSQGGIGNVKYHHGDHSTELKRLAETGFTAAAIMFNLGYLPGSDRRVATTGASTVTAIESAQRLLRPGGVMTVIAYRGHAGGHEEATAIDESVNAQGSREFTVDRINGDEENAASPVLFVWRRS